MKKAYSYVTIFFICLVILLQYINDKTHSEKIDTILKNQLQDISLVQKIIHNNFRKITDNAYHIIIDNNDIINTFEKAYRASGEERKGIRTELEGKLFKTFSYLKSIDIEKIYFNFPDNINFLRMHEPEKFGDDLSSNRETIDYVSKYKKPIQSFHVGEYGSEFSFAFPLITDKGEYIGSVEITILPKSVVTMLNDINYANTHFIIRKSVLDNIMDKDELAKEYISSYESDDFYQKKESHVDNSAHHISQNNIEKFSYEIDEKLQKDKAFALYTDDGFIVSFTPLKGMNTTETQAYFVYYHDAEIIANNIINYWVIFTLLHIFLIILIYYLYKDYRYKSKILKLNSTLSKNINREVALKNGIEKQAKAFETLFEKSSDGILILENRKFIQCNETIVKMLKYDSKDDLLKCHPSDLSPKFQPDGRESFEKAEEMMELALQRGTHSFQWQHTRSNGEVFWALITLTPVSFLNRNVIHVTWRDISESKDMEKQLEEYANELEVRVLEEVEKNKQQQQKLFDQTRLAQMGRMISMIAHQWRQPLGAIASTSIDLKMKLELETFKLQDKDDREKCIEYFYNSLSDIDGFVQNLTVTIDDFRNFYKPNKSSSLIKVNIPIEKSLKVVRKSLESNNIELNEEYNSNSIVEIYENEMMQVILNILNNSQDNFLDKKVNKPRIDIKTYDSDGYTVVEVYDNGGGIEDSILDSIFDPYFSTKGEQQGSGLGLYMSKIIIESHHHGTLIAKNRDDGICFIIELKRVV